jgi:hypothetical protein
MNAHKLKFRHVGIPRTNQRENLVDSGDQSALPRGLEEYHVVRGIKGKTGVQTGVQFTFDFAQPNAYAGFKLSLERFHN